MAKQFSGIAGNKPYLPTLNGRADRVAVLHEVRCYGGKVTSLTVTNIYEVIACGVDNFIQIYLSDIRGVAGFGNAALQYRQVFVVTVKIKCIAVKMEYSDVFHFFSSSSILPSLPKADAARI